MFFSRATRAYKIFHTMARYRIDDVVLGENRSLLIKSIRYLNPWFYWPQRKMDRGQRLRLALETLGPIFVKFGQVLSTRRDLLPLDIADELTPLQDHVKPFDSKIAKKIIETSLQKPLSAVFEKFEDKPLASASIAQVHAATLKNGDEVIVKVLRPDVKKQIEKDISLLRTLAGFIEKAHRHGDRIRPREIIEEFAITLQAELDLTREAANASKLYRNFADSDKLYVPSIYWEYTQPNVMVMERISGIPIANIDALKKQGSDLKQLAETGLEVFFTQVFNHNFFHADMHPGNIFISEKNVNKYIVIDYGIVGTLTEEDRRYIAENLLAFFKRDYHLVAKLHVDAGWVDKDTRVSELEAAIRTVSEPVFEKPLKDISMGYLLLRLFQIARQFNMNVQPQLILLQKTLLNMEGLGRQLYPELDLWKTAKPFLERWVNEQIGLRGLVRNIKQNIPFWIEKLPEMPTLLHDTLVELKKERQPVVVSKKTKPLRKSTIITGFGIGVLFSSALMLPTSITSTTIAWTMLSIGIGTTVLGLLGLLKRK